MNTQEPIEHYSEFVTHKDKDLEILGEVFEDSIRRSADHEIHTQVSIIDVMSGQLVFDGGQPLRFNYTKRNDLETLKLLVKEVKEKINILYP